jgi:hypothetical protein
MKKQIQRALNLICTLSDLFLANYCTALKPDNYFILLEDLLRQGNFNQTKGYQRYLNV